MHVKLQKLWQLKRTSVPNFFHTANGEDPSRPATAPFKSGVTTPSTRSLSKAHQLWNTQRTTLVRSPCDLDHHLCCCVMAPDWTRISAATRLRLHKTVVWSHRQVWWLLTLWWALIWLHHCQHNRQTALCLYMSPTTWLRWATVEVRLRRWDGLTPCRKLLRTPSANDLQTLKLGAPLGKSKHLLPKRFFHKHHLWTRSTFQEFCWISQQVYKPPLAQATCKGCSSALLPKPAMLWTLKWIFQDVTQENWPVFHIQSFQTTASDHATVQLTLHCIFHMKANLSVIQQAPTVETPCAPHGPTCQPSIEGRRQHPRSWIACQIG